tara:strand:+ start:448 stop:645 length:198 start_codon:yes stop_codon:yes gene_type:complete
MGSAFRPKAPPPPKADPAIEEARKQEEVRAEKIKKEQDIYEKKVARGVIGTRSLFSQAGGRGFFG